MKGEDISYQNRNTLMKDRSKQSCSRCRPVAEERFLLRSDTHNSGQVQKVLSDNLQAALTRTRTPAQALSAAQAQADQILSQFRKK